MIGRLPHHSMSPHLLSTRARARVLSAALALVLFGLTAAPLARADVTLPSIISDNMVLQQRSKMNVWGKADPGESVTVTLGPESAQTTAAQDGSWAVRISGLKSGGPYDMTISGKNALTVHNVAVGEVWLCSGESNMEFKVIAAKNSQAEMADADLPMVREFKVKRNASDKPQGDCEGSWVVCNPDTVRDFSAIGYFFARELNRGMREPIGLIESAWGPSPIESWTPRTVLEKDPDMHAALDRYDKATSGYTDALAAYQAKMTEWHAAAGASPSAPKPVQPLPPGGPREPGALYNGMITPLLRYPIRGVLWYQGESNTYEPVLYRKLFPAMIASWRKGWSAADLPFLHVQLPGFLQRHLQPTESLWASLREAQSMALSVPKTGMAVTIDLGDEHNMHPEDKQDVSHRLALIAENQVYGKSGLTTSGPVFSSMDIRDGKVALSFAHEDGGLTTGSGGALKGFAIAGADRNFVWADATIQGDKVIALSKDVPKPVSVRYAWADMPDAGLFSVAGLPAAPFRTDTWIPGESAPTATPSTSPSPSHHKARHHPTAD